MSESGRVQVESRTELRAWLEANHANTDSVWLVIYKKHIPNRTLPYEDVVEEALCFGWIDSRTRRLDDDRAMLRLSPRRPGSPWSRRNKQLVARLTVAGLMAPPGLAAVERAKEDGSWTVFDEIEDLIVPPDLAKALAGNDTAASYFHAFSDASKRAILWWIKSAKRPATRQRRIADTVRLAEHNLRASHPEAREFDRTQG